MEIITHIGKIISVLGAIGGCLYFILSLTLVKYITKEQADSKYMQKEMCDREHINLKDKVHSMDEEIRYLRDKK